VLDGEIVTLDESGKPSFERLQSRMQLAGETAIRRRAREIPAVYVIFDALWLAGAGVKGLTADVARRAVTGSLDVRTVHAFAAAGSAGQHATVGTRHASPSRLRTDLRSYPPTWRFPLAVPQLHALPAVGRATRWAAGAASLPTLLERHG
jgi:hypothetical protein